MSCTRGEEGAEGDSMREPPAPRSPARGKQQQPGARAESVSSNSLIVVGGRIVLDNGVTVGNYLIQL
jgi:hypothetical protein